MVLLFHIPDLLVNRHKIFRCAVLGSHFKHEHTFISYFFEIPVECAPIDDSFLMERKPMFLINLIIIRNMKREDPVTYLFEEFRMIP